MGDQNRFFQNIKSVQLEKTKKVEPQCIRAEEECCKTKVVSARDGCDSSARC